MERSRLRRLGWTMALATMGMSYAACAWLWAAPYRGSRDQAPSPVEPAPPLVQSGAVLATPGVPAKRREASANGAQAGDKSAEAPASVAAPEPLKVASARTPPLGNTRNFLVVGLDRRPDGTGPALADTLVVIVLDEASQHVGLVSIPRDLYVAIPEAETDRINTVYQVARRSKREPLQLLSRVVEDTLKLPIEHALALDLGVFERAVDAVGGVDVDVPCAIRDNFVDSRTETGRRMLDVDPGRRHLDGVTAAMYARSRHGRSDFHRARRQQAVLLGVQHALAGLGVIKLPDLWQSFEASVETDMRRFELLGLARRALRLDPTHLHGLVIGAEHVQGTRTPEGKSVLVPNYEAIDAALGKLFSAPSPGVRPKLAVCEPKDAALGPA